MNDVKKKEKLVLIYKNKLKTRENKTSKLIHISSRKKGIFDLALYPISSITQKEEQYELDKGFESEKNNI